jgi:NAD-dependent DNA ligase
VSKKINDVVAGESAGAKIEKARKLKIQVLDEALLREMLDALPSL